MRATDTEVTEVPSPKKTPRVVEDARFISMGWLFWVVFVALCLSLIGIPIAILLLIIAFFSQKSVAAKTFDQQLRDAISSGEEFIVKRKYSRVIVWGGLGVIALLCALIASESSHAADWEYRSAESFVLCDTKKDAKKWKFPHRVQGCKVIETGPYRRKCTKSCTFGKKRYIFEAPTKTQIQAHNHGNDAASMLGRAGWGKYPASNASLKPYYGKNGWVKRCPINQCTSY